MTEDNKKHLHLDAAKRGAKAKLLEFRQLVHINTTLLVVYNPINVTRVTVTQDNPLRLL